MKPTMQEGLYPSLGLDRVNPKLPLNSAACAVIVQALAYAAAHVLNWLLPPVLQLPLFGLVLMQAILAALVSRCIAMPRWWHAIHFIFPLAVWAMLHWQLPSSIYLYGFVLSVSLFWTTFRSQVPFYPSGAAARRELDRLLPKNRQISMVDIGSGLGDLAMHISASRPGSRIVGVEIAPLPWLISRMRAWFRKSSARFDYGDYRKLDFADFDVVFAYLSPAAMTALWQKACTEMRPGTLLISYEFEIEGVPCVTYFQENDDVPKMYVWQM
ncbi:MAG TPA: class I SAM-dependent methyltransferase [Methylophilaceae bacterium]|nr:class I SAM-dependent methyltransferase [Methylophilaceae bacterium]